jgi:hypothetical protein
VTIEIVRYSDAMDEEWNRLVGQARNGLFLFDRRYMDYHRERFDDMSLIARIDGRAAALLPASFDAERALATSHGGLTFGGVLLRRDLRGPVALEAIDAMLDALRGFGARELEVRLLPAFLADYPSGEVDYALWRRGFALVRRDLSTAIPLGRAPFGRTTPFNSSKRQAIAKARKIGLEVGNGSLDRFHALLEQVLGERHGAPPVHSAADLKLLTGRFPEQILLRAAEQDGEMLAGVLVYRYPTAWHTQYMATSIDGRNRGALDLIIATLIDEAREAGAGWLSFGASTTNGGRDLNEGLLWQKESFGGRSVTHDFMRGTL